MAKKGEVRKRITLQCIEFNMDIYRTEKNKKNTTERLELKKICPKCRKSTKKKKKK